MSTISDFSGFNPRQIPFTSGNLQQAIQERIQAADSDQNGAISKEEAKTTFADMESAGKTLTQHQGPSGDMLNKMFEKADANSDGELSQQEQQRMFARMEEQMAKMKSMMSPVQGASQGKFNSFESLLNSLNSDEVQSEKSGDKNISLIAERYQLKKQSPVDILA